MSQVCVGGLEAAYGSSHTGRHVRMLAKFIIAPNGATLEPFLSPRTHHIILAG